MLWDLESLSFCDAACQGELKSLHAYYIDCEVAKELSVTHYQSKLEMCGLQDDCNMECVKECSFWTWSPWTDCFTECECTNPPEYYDTYMMVESNFANTDALIWRASGKNWEGTAGYDWQWLGIQGN